ncbi:hypothetical protein SAMN05216378_5360 [Paenibacillus catalpae]|uniref:Uncharacterized protein n=1 Tax=Paenibacillus catalpae TaxID=1045775 RepID=A0A1I2GNB9_9BACL|nr:hypothetical protein [Paenibacillus catalpae]SFF18768.1 hypothetical protein SAMN05216378_5360 [Paenibacillus catalpae]
MNDGWLVVGGWGAGVSPSVAVAWQEISIGIRLSADISRKAKANAPLLRGYPSLPPNPPAYPRSAPSYLRGRQVGKLQGPGGPWGA